MREIITEIPERQWYDLNKFKPLSLVPIIIRFKCFYSMETRNGFIKFNGNEDFHYHVGVILTKEQSGFDGVFQELSSATVKEKENIYDFGTWIPKDSEWIYV